MSLFYRLLICFLLISFSAKAYHTPLGIYVLEYPVDMPDVSLVSEQNKEMPILDTTADLTVMVFWTQTCAPCLREMKYLEEYYPKAKRHNINLFLVSPAGEWKSNKEERLFLAKFGAPTIPFYHDVDNALSLKLGIGSTPYAVVMDRYGKKVATIQGEVEWDSSSFQRKIKKLIK